VFAVLDVVGIVIFALSGEIGGDELTAIAVALPGVGVGAAAGIGLRRYLSPARFRGVVLVLLVIAGVTAIVSALTR